MTRILHIDSSARYTGSQTRQLSGDIVSRLSDDDTAVLRRDLSDGLPFLDAGFVEATFVPAEARSAEQRSALSHSDTLVEELEAADTIVIGAPIYNFGVPAALKAWIDQVARAGRTFRYTDSGPEGLLKGKRAIVAIASGGVQVGSDADFASRWLHHVLGFLGIDDVTVVTADTLEALLPAERDTAEAA